MQVRSARAEISTQRTRDIKRHNNEAFHQLTQDPSLTDLHIRAQTDFDSLDDVEKLRWGIWLFTWINQTEDGYLSGRAGIPDMEWVDSYILGVALVLRTTGGQHFWGRMRGFFDQDFADRLDQEIAAGTTTYLEALLH